MSLLCPSIDYNVRTTVVVCEGAKWIFRAGTCAIPTAYRLIRATRPKSAAKGAFFDELLILWLYLFPVDILLWQKYDYYSQNRRITISEIPVSEQTYVRDLHQHCTLRTLSDTPERAAECDNLLQSTLTQLDSNREVARAHAGFDDLLPRSFFIELFKKCLDHGVSLYQLTSSPVSNWRDELQNIFLHWFYHQRLPSGESDFPLSLTGSVPRSPMTTTSLRCSFDDVPDEILWVIFSYVGSFLSRLPILGVLCCFHRFQRIALPLLYRNLEFTTPSHFVQMRDAWAMVPKVFEQHVTTVTLGCIDSHHYPIHFDVLWPDITTFTWALTSLTVLRLTGITLSFDFFLFTTSSLTRNIEATLEGCVVNCEALNPVIELHFSKLTIFDIRWKKHALGDVQDGAGPIIVNLIVRCPDLTLARIPVDRSLIIHVLTWRVFKSPHPLTDLGFTFIWPAKPQAKMMMAATVLKLLKKNAPLNSVSLLHDSEGFAMLYEHHQALIPATQRPTMEGRIRRITASLEFAQFLRGRIGFDIFLEMAKSWPAHTLKVKTRQCAPGIDRSLLMTNLSSVLDEAQELIHAREVWFENILTKIEMDYTLRESLAWAMIPSYKCTSFENHPGFLKYAAHLWAARFPEDERGGQPSEEERTIQAEHADLPQPHELESWIANYTEDWMWRRKRIISTFSNSHKIEQHERLVSAIEDCLDQGLRLARSCIKHIQPDNHLSELREAVFRWDLYHILPQNLLCSDLLPLILPPYAHLKSVPRRSIFTPMRWMYPLPGVDFESFDQAMDKLNNCISDSKSLIRNMDSGLHEGCKILALACMLRDEENDEDEEVSDKENQVPTTDYSEIDALYWPTSEVDIGSAGKGDICATAGGHDKDDHLFANSSDVEFCNPIGNNNADDDDNLFVNSSDIEICNSTGDNNDDEDNVFVISSDIEICDAISDNNDDNDANDVDDYLWSETTYVNALVDNQDLKFCVEEDGIFKKKDHVRHDLRISLLAVPRLLLCFSNPVDNATPLQNHLLFCYASNLLYAKNHGRVHLTDALPPSILDLVKRLFLDTTGFADALSSTSSSLTGFLASTSEKAMASFVYHAALFIVSAMPRQRQKPIDGFDSHYLSDLRDLEEPSTQFLSTFFPSNPQHASIRHRDAAPSFKVSLGHRVVSSRSVVPTELLYSLPVEPPIIDAASHPYVTHAAPNVYLYTHSTTLHDPVTSTKTKRSSILRWRAVRHQTNYAIGMQTMSKNIFMSFCNMREEDHLQNQLVPVGWPLMINNPTSGASDAPSALIQTSGVPSV
ncbi:hypothetical protein F5051DRAFT_433973, partial [Lentinula edodes]